MGSYTRTYSLTDGTVAYGSQVAYELDALGSSVNNITNSQISSGAAIADSKLAQITTPSKVSGAAITLLTSLPSGAGIIPAANLPTVAVQADMEAASSTTAPVVPGVVKYHPGVAKAWVYFTNSGTPTIVASENVSSLTDQGNGDTTVTFTTAFSSANYAAVATAEGQRQYAAISSGGKAAGSVRVITGSGDSANQSDDNTSVVCFGDFS